MAVHSSSVVDVAIIGGGPCGLATALALSKARCLRGAAVEVFESDAFGPKGASIGLSETGWAALAGIDAEAAQRVRATGALSRRNGRPSLVITLSEDERLCVALVPPQLSPTQARLSPVSASAP